MRRHTEEEGFELVSCDECENEETISDREVTQETLEGEGWFFAADSERVLCPDCNETVFEM